MTAAETPNDDLAPVEGLIRGLSVSTNALAVIANLCVMATIFNSPKLLAINEIALNMSLTVADFCFAVLFGVIIGAGAPDRAAFFDNRVLCILAGIGLQVLAIGSMLTLLLISLNNTWVILLGKQHVSRGQIGIGIAVVWLVTVGYTCMVMIIPGGGFVKQPSSFHCGLDAVSTHPIAVAIRLMTITIMICTPICICVFYVMITLKLRASSRDLTQLAVAPPSPNATPRSSLARLATEGPAVIREGRSRYTSVNACVGNMDSDENTSDTSDKASMLARKASLSQESRKLALQVALVKRAVALVTAFLLSWVPYLAVIMHGAITLVNISPLVEAVSAIFASCGALLNPVLLMVMDTRYREAFLVLIGRPMPYLPTWNDRT